MGAAVVAALAQRPLTVFMVPPYAQNRRSADSTTYVGALWYVCVSRSNGLMQPDPRSSTLLD